jgi:hypothetical protein
MVIKLRIKQEQKRLRLPPLRRRQGALKLPMIKRVKKQFKTKNQ